MRKNIKRTAAVLLAMLLSMMLYVCVSAEDEKCMGLFISYDENGDAADVKTGVPLCIGDEYYVITNADQGSSKNFIFALSSDTAFEAVYQGNFTDNTYIWEIDSSVGSYLYPNASSYSSEESGMIVYYDDNLEFASADVVFEEYETNNGYGFIYTSDAGVSGVAAAMNSNLEFVGVYVGNNTIVTAEVISEDEFSGGSSGGSGSSSGSGSSGGGSSGSGSSGSSSSGSSSSSSAVSYIIIAAVVVCLAAALFFVFRKKPSAGSSSDKGGSGGNSGGSDNKDDNKGKNINDPVDIEEIENMNIKVDDQKRKPDKKESSSFSISCERGIMSGRVYNIGKQPITIGRDKDSVIRFPADTKYVSRVHCKIFWNKGVLMLVDEGSKFGTYIKNKGKLSEKAPVPISYGDTFYVGDRSNKFVIK